MSVATSTCPICGAEFTPNPFGGNTAYCSPACGLAAHRHGPAPVVVGKTTTKAIRTAPMTDDEFADLYAKLRRQLEHEGKPLYRLDMGGHAEKQNRIEAHNARSECRETRGNDEGGSE